MIADFEKEDFPIWCEQCDQQGYIFVENFEDSHFVTCTTCGWETSEVWCPKCGMGGEYVRNIDKRPSFWHCPNCKTKYDLPDGFYENPVSLFTEDALPLPVRERLKKEVSPQSLAKNLLMFIVLLAGILVMIAIWLLPLALIFTPLPWTVPGFIVTLLVFPVWWWLSTRIVKNVRARFAKQTS